MQIEIPTLFRIALTAIVVLFTSTSLSNATPKIIGVEGSITNESSIVIKGQGFGAKGPNIILYDNFENAAAHKQGSDIDLSATVGNWDKTGLYSPVYDDFSHSGSYSMRIYKDGKNFRQFRKAFPEKVTEVFISFWVAVPPNTLFPHRHSSPSLGDFPEESAWKFTWLMNEDTGSPGQKPSDNDICVPTHISKGQMVFSGNTLTLTDPYVEMSNIDSINDWWMFGKFNRISGWLKADPKNPAKSNGTIWGQGLSQAGQYIFKQHRPVFEGGSAPYQWGYITVPGWARNLSENTRPVYDDFYLAIGENSAARVEIGDNPIYEKSTNLSISVPEYWSDETIKAKIHLGSLNPKAQHLYLFVIDKDGKVSNSFAIPFIRGMR